MDQEQMTAQCDFSLAGSVPWVSFRVNYLTRSSCGTWREKIKEGNKVTQIHLEKT